MRVEMRVPQRTVRGAVLAVDGKDGATDGVTGDVSKEDASQRREGESEGRGVSTPTVGHRRGRRSGVGAGPVGTWGVRGVRSRSRSERSVS